MRNNPENHCHMDDLQIINKYDSILDVIYFNTKYTTKIETLLTKLDVE